MSGWVYLWLVVTKNKKVIRHKPKEQEILQYGRNWRKRNPGCDRKWRKNNSEKVKAVSGAYNRMRNYGLSMEGFYALQKTQNNRCRICRKKFDKTPAVDHNHKTGAVRGLLCGPCNTGLGMFKDSVRFLAAAIKYLKCGI